MSWTLVEMDSVWDRPESLSQTNALLPIPVFTLLWFFSFPFAHPFFLPSSRLSNNNDAV